jgi:hypothetical protein
VNSMILPPGDVDGDEGGTQIPIPCLVAVAESDAIRWKEASMREAWKDCTGYATYVRRLE